MNTLSISVSNEQKKFFYIDPTAPQRELLTWLYAVHTHALAGSRESRATLVKLFQYIPEYDFTLVEIQENVKKITLIAEKKQWNLDLVSLSSLTFRAVRQLYFPESIEFSDLQ